MLEGLKKSTFQMKEFFTYMNRRKVEATENVLLVGGDETFPYVLDIAKERNNGIEAVGDFSLSFAKKYVESGMLKEGRKLLIVRTAVGGTGFKRGIGEKEIFFFKACQYG